MNDSEIPNTESIKELAEFWDTHDLTDFEDQLEEVKEPVFHQASTPQNRLADTDGVEALRTFIGDNDDLEQLETLLDRFNMFEALGLVRQEIRHSAFLRWLLDPTETHGLDDYFLRQFLRQVIKAGEGISDDAPSLFDLDGWNFGRAEVRKEWRNIDLLIVNEDEDHRFVCAIENKVDSGEGLHQLERYREIVEHEFKGYRKAFVFLTISGYPPDPPSDETWVPMSYGGIASVVENTLKKRESQLNDEIRLFVQQYLDMVRRHIVEDSDIQELCHRLYKNHRRALDLIFEHRPDRADEVSQVIQDYIKSRKDLIPDYFSKTYIKFLPRSMDIPQLQYEERRLLAWLLENKNGTVQFRLEMQPGPQQIREQVYEEGEKRPGIFGKPKPKLSPTYHSFFSETWITQKEYNDLSAEEIRQRLDKRIEDFSKTGQKIADALKGLK